MAASEQTKIMLAKTKVLRSIFLYIWYMIKLYIIGALALLCQLLRKTSDVNLQQAEADTEVLRGRTAVVTGGSAGIGYHISRLLARHGARVVIGSRSKTEAEDAIARIKQEEPKAEVDYIPLDLSSFKSVQHFADEFLQRHRMLHLLINNGVMLVPHQVTEDGNEYHLQVNHLSHALLTSHLLPRLESSATVAHPSHIINVTSVVHHVASLDPDTFGEKCDGDWSYCPHNAYAASKLAILLYTKALSRRLREKQSNVIVSAVHPGVVNSGLYQNVHWTVAWVFHIMKRYLFMHPQQAAMSILRVATLCDQQTYGAYYSLDTPVTASSQSSVLLDQETVYQRTCTLIEMKT